MTKSSIEMMNASIAPDSTPGISSGRVIFQKAFHGEA